MEASVIDVCRASSGKRVNRLLTDQKGHFCDYLGPGQLEI